MENTKPVYSDGSIEDIIIENLKKKQQIITGPLSDNTGAVFHNFTDARENLINWYPFRADADVLEVGAGMGALTGYLCRRCANVVAVEPSEKRAEIIRLRLAGLDNLEVLCGDVTEIKSTKRFDYILLIGVLEYAGISNTFALPHEKLLSVLQKMLKPNGILLVAIENRFGLKYWCGASEDHTGIPFDGIAGYQDVHATPRYGIGGVCTFSRNTLATMLKKSGFFHSNWYYPLPDYKFPMAIFSDSKLPMASDIDSIKFSYAEESLLVADERKLYKEIIENGCFPFFANSFLVEASVNRPIPISITYASFKRDYKSNYRLITLVNAQKQVLKRAVTDDAKGHFEKYVRYNQSLQSKGIPTIDIHVQGDCIVQEWQDFPRADAAIHDMLDKAQWEQVYSLVNQLQDRIMQSSANYNSTQCALFGVADFRFEHPETILIDGYVDMTFANSFLIEGNLFFFDQEWCFSNVPVKFILYRAVKYVCRDIYIGYAPNLYNCVGIDNGMVEQFESVEQLLLHGMMSKVNCSIFDRKMFHNELTLMHRNSVKQKELQKCYDRILQLQDEVEERNSHLHKLDNEIENYRNVINSMRTELNSAELNNKQLKQNTEQLAHSAERILQLQDEVEERNNHLYKLDSEIENYRNVINSMRCELEDLVQKHGQLKQEHGTLQEEHERLQQGYNILLQKNSSRKQNCSILQQENDDLKRTALESQQKIGDLKKATAESQQEIRDLRRAAAESQQEIESLRQIVRNKEGHIELLLEVEREYEREKNSRTFRLARIFRKISSLLLPPRSVRRFFVRMIGKAIRHPRLMLHVVNPRRIRNFFRIYKKEGMEGVQHHYQLVEEVESSRIYPSGAGQYEVEAPAKDTEAAGLGISDYAPLQFPEHETPAVSIIIPVYNQFDYTYHCLESIQKHSGEVAYEIIVADDCSTDLTQRLSEAVKGIRVIRNTENLRFLRNCNNAAAYARGKYIMFLNNDTQVQENWLAPLVELMEKNGGIGMTGSKLVYADGSLQEAGGIFWKDASAWNYGNRRNPDDPEFNYVKDVDYISGASIMIRSALWKEIGGFDERFAPAYYEDSDLAFEVRKLGYRVVYQPLSVVVHFEGISNGTDLSSGQKAYQAANQQKFYEKWKDVLEREHFPNGEEVFLARDRSRGKPTLLMIDHYVPTYDQDAGSRTLYQYLKLFAEEGYSLKLIGDNFYKSEPYTTVYEQMGIEVLVGPYYLQNWKKWIIENSRYIDYIFMNRPHITEKYIDFVRENTHAKLIYYGMDLHYLREQRSYEINPDPAVLKRAEDWKKREYNILRKVDMAYYLSQVELDEIAKVDPSIPTRKNPINIFEDVPDIPYEPDNRKDIIFVGGFTHLPNGDAVTWMLQEIFPLIHQKKPDIRLHIVGSNPPDKIKKQACRHIIVHGFVPDEELEALYSTVRIMVVPLRFGAGIKGKVIEAMRYGIPVITTSIGIEGIEGAETFICVKDSAEEIAQAVLDLYGDTGLLEKVSVQEKAYVEANYSKRGAIQILGKDFKFREAI